MSLQDELIRCAAVRFGNFTLTSGKKSPYYVDVKRASTLPDLLRHMALAMLPLVQEADLVAGVELGAVPLVTAVSLESGKPMAIIRKPGRSHGTGQGIEGQEVEGKTVCLLEDVVTTGGSVVEAIGRLRAAGATVAHVVAVVDRNEGGREALAAIDVTFTALVTAEALITQAGVAHE